MSISQLCRCIPVTYQPEMCTHTGGMLDHLWPNDHVSLQQVKWWCKVYQGEQAVSNWWPTVHGLMLSIPAGGYTYKKLTWQHTSIDQQPTVSWVPPQPMLGVGKPHQTPCGGIWAASLQTCTWPPSLPLWPAHSPRPPLNTWNQTETQTWRIQSEPSSWWSLTACSEDWLQT